MGPSNLTGDNCEGPIAPAVPFEPVGMDKHGMGDAAPFAHQPRASLHEIGVAGFCASLASESRFRRSSLRRIDLERPPRACSTAMSIDDLAMSATTTRLDAVTAVVASHFRSCQRETEFLLHRARQKPAHAVLLPVCCLHHLSDARPSGWLSRVSMRSCLVTRSTFGSSALTGVLAAAARSDFGFLAMTVADVTLRRRGA